MCPEPEDPEVPTPPALDRTPADTQAQPPPATAPAGSLRKRAEAQLAARAGKAPDPSPEEVRQLLYDLQVHQIELEMQNEELRRTQNELAQSGDRWLDLYDYAPVGYLTLDRDDMVREANLTLARMLGRQQKELIGRPIAQLVARESRDALYLHARQAFAAGVKQVCELILRRSDGTTLEARLETVPATDPLSGAPLSLLRTAVLDVSAERAAERSVEVNRAAMARLRQLGTLLVQEGRLASVLEEIVETAIAITAADLGSIQLLDAATGELHIAAQRGLPPGWLEYWSRVTKGQGPCGTALELGERVIIEDIERSPLFVGTEALEIQRRAGVRAVQSTPLLSRSGTPLGVLSTHYRRVQRPDERALGLLDLLACQAADIIERVQAEQALRESETHFRQLADAMPQLVWTAAPDGRIDYINRRAADFDGIHQEPNGTWSWQGGVAPEDARYTLELWQTAVASGEPYQVEHRMQLADGSLRWHLSRAVPVRNRSRRVVKWYGTATDIQDLKQAQEALQEADRRKDEFLAILAHELRNPLAPIRNAVEILRLKGSADPILQTARDIIDRQVDHMVRLIDDLLDVSRITRSKLQVRTERVELTAILEQVLETCRPLVERGRHLLRVDLPPQPIHLDADPVRLTQVLSNLLSNACRYTESGGRIHLSAQPAGGEVAVRVKDNGIGIPPEHLPRIFDLFVQGPSTSEQSRGGLGIGLSLARALVEMHGGRIEVQSDGPARGSIFTVWLPVAAAGAQALRAPAQAAEDREAAPTRVLVVDDNEDVLQSLALMLQVHGNEVQTARDGVEAVEAAERFRPDLVLLDIGMPKLDGYGACRRIREQPWGKDLKIVALTGWGQDADRRETAAAGFDGHLVKPVAPEALLRLLAEGHPHRA
jgi:PAS domain S-box-containing protein